MTPAYELSDEELLRVTKMMIDRVKEKSLTGYEGIFATAAAAALIQATKEMNATDFTIGMDGYSKGEEPKENWEVIVRKK
jgi:hypothetical protein